MRSVPRRTLIVGLGVLGLGAVVAVTVGLGRADRGIQLSLADPAGPEAIAEWCENVTGAIGPGQPVATVRQLVARIPSGDLADPPPSLTPDERQEWATAHPDYVTSTFFVLLAGAPPAVETAYRTVAQAFTAAHAGRPPADLRPARAAAGAVDAYVARRC